MSREAERKRLIELLNVDMSGCNGDYAEEMADYLLENGVIVPPCKVGDTVYEFFNVIGFYDINELIVENIVIGVTPRKCQIYTKSKYSGSKDIFYEDSFGKVLFFSKAEAEYAMKNRRSVSLVNGHIEE